MAGAVADIQRPGSHHWIAIKGNPQLRVIWDSKEGWLVPERHRARGGWEDVWIAKTEADQTLTNLLCEIRSQTDTDYPIVHTATAAHRNIT